MKVKVQFEFETGDLRLCGECQLWDEKDGYCEGFNEYPETVDEGECEGDCIRLPQCLAATMKFWKPISEMEKIRTELPIMVLLADGRGFKLGYTINRSAEKWGECFTHYAEIPAVTD